MYITINKNTGLRLNDTGTRDDNPNYNAIGENVKARAESWHLVLEVDDNSPYVKLMYKILSDGKNCKFELDGDKIIDIKAV